MNYYYMNGIIRCIKALDKDVIVIIGCDLVKIVGEKQ